MKELSQIAASLADLYARWLPYRARGAFPLGCSSGFLVCPRKRCNHLVIKYNNMRCWPNISVKMVGPGPNVDLKLGHFCCPCLWSWCHLPTANLQFIQRNSIVHFNIVSERLPLSTEFKPLTIKQRFLMSLTSNVSWNERNETVLIKFPGSFYSQRVHVFQLISLLQIFSLLHQSLVFR